MKSALLIGLGGVGCRVINQLKDNVTWRDNIKLEDRGVRYLYLDTATEYMEDRDKGVHLTVSQPQAQSIRSIPEDKRSWLATSMIRGVSNGAGATRMVGKLAFYANYSKVSNRIQGTLQQLHNQAPNNELLVFVVASSASGTGSGAFVDLGYMLRNIITNSVMLANKPNLKLILMLAMPVNPTYSSHYLNAHFALAELDFYQSGNHPFSIDSIINEGATINNEGAVNRKPYDFVYLVANPPAVTPDIDSVINSMSEYIYCEALSSAGDVAGARRDDFQPYLQQTDNHGLSTAYCAYGLGMIEYPASQIVKLASVLYTLAALDYWEQKGSNPTQLSFEDMLLDDKREGLRRRLTREVAYSSDRGESITVNIVEQIRNARGQALLNFEQNEYDTEHLRNLISQLQRGFSEVKNPEVLGVGITEGLISHTVRTNVEIGLQSWFSDIRTRVYTHIFTNIDGLNIGRTALERIIERLKGLQSEQAEPILEVEGVLDEMDTIRRDALLRPFRSHIIKRLKEDFSSRLDRYIRDRLDKIILDKAQGEIGATLSLVEDLKTRVERLAPAVVGLRNKLMTEGQRLRGAPTYTMGYLVDGGGIERRAETLRDQMSTKTVHKEFISGSLASICAEQMKNADISVSFMVEDIMSRARSIAENCFQNPGVLSEFQRELRSPNSPAAGQLGNVHTTSSVLTLSLDQGNPSTALHMQGNANTHFHRVFFSGGGGSGVTPDAQWFTNELQNMAIVGSGGVGASTVKLDSNNVVIFAQERGAFPLHFFQDIRNNTAWTGALNALAQTADNVEVPLYLGRLDVSYPGYMPQDIWRIRQAKQDLWLAVLCHALDFEGRVVRFTQGADTYSLSRHFNVAIREVAAKPNMSWHLVNKCQAKINECGPYEFVLRIHTMINGNWPEQFLGVSGDLSRERKQLLTTWIITNPNPAYLAAWNSNPDFLPLTQNVFNRVIAVQVPNLANGHPISGYYTQCCNRYLDSLAITEAELEHLLAQHSC